MRFSPVMASVIANCLFWPLLFIMAALRPEYSHFTKAVSELGTVDAPRRWVWNVLGYIVPGILIAVAGWQIGRRFGANAYFLPGLLSLAGLFMTLSGIFPGDMAHMDSTTTRTHLLGAFGSLGAYVLALILIVLKFRGEWRPAAIMALACLGLLAASVVFGSPHGPGLAQRLMFATFLCSYPAFALVQKERAENRTTALRQ